ncbi:methyltransferase family protein [Massilia consociata]|uniref:Methyltransferase family protein n=1 Tax=Massilia consociata TaxID=760117 RepID=A0ABV6FBB0_9BURK
MAPNAERLVLFAAFLLYFAAAFLWPTFRVWRMTGRNPYVLPSTDDAYGVVTAGMRAVMAGILGYIVVQLCWPELEPAFGPLAWLDRPAASMAGWVGLGVAVAWTVVAQVQMRMSWRIGIDRQHRTALVTTGLFALSRNPIFLAMRLSLLSLVLLRPNAVTVALMLVGEVLMQLQVRLEEAFLRELHGAPYAAYCARVRRWL